MHHVVVHRARVCKDDRTQGRGAPPFPHGLVTSPGRAQGVQGLDPGGIRPVPLVEGREDEPLAAQEGPRCRWRCEGSSAPTSSSAQEIAARKRGLLDARLLLRDVEERAEPVDLCTQRRSAARGPLPVRRRRRAGVRHARSAARSHAPAAQAPARRMPPRSVCASWASMTCDRLPSSCRIVSVLRTSACRMRSSGRCV